MSDSLTPQAVKILENLAQLNTKPTDHPPKDQAGLHEIGQDIKKSIEASPLLTWQFNHAVKEKSLEKITLDNESFFPTEVRPEASYSPKDKNIRLVTQNIDGIMPIWLIHDIGHEIHHALTREDILTNTKNFNQHITLVANQPGERDYTQAISNAVKFRRQNEAEAEINGWNTAMSAANTAPSGFKISPEQLAGALGKKRETFINLNTQKALPNLNFEKDGMIQMTTENVEATAKNFYDQRPYRAIIALEYIDDALAADSVVKRDPNNTNLPKINLKALNLTSQDLQKMPGLASHPSHKIIDTSNPDNPTVIDLNNMQINIPRPPHTLPEKQSSNASTPTTPNNSNHLVSGLWQEAIQVTQASQENASSKTLT